MEKAAIVVSVPKLLEGLAEVEDLEASVVPRGQEVRHLDNQASFTIKQAQDRHHGS